MPYTDSHATNQLDKSPHLPAFLSAPFRLVPRSLHSKILVHFLNRILAEQIKDGELDFLNHKRVMVQVNDASISYYISLLNGRLTKVMPSDKNDLTIQANVYDYLSLIARKEDSDTLVFQRRLIMQGETELGLELKNFLDSLDIDSQNSFKAIESLLHKSLPVYKRLFS